MPKAKPLTTGQAAKYCNVSQVTIINWIKKGQLKAYSTPGGHHRILLTDFVSFLEEYQMPVDAALRALSRPTVLIVSDSPRASTLVSKLESYGRFDVILAQNGYDASAQVVRSEPDAVVLDTTSVVVDNLSLCQWLRASPDEEPVRVVAVGGPKNEKSTRSADVNKYVTSTVAAGKLETELETLLELG